MSGQNRKDPFHVNRDVVRDNLTVTRKIRLPRGAQIRAQRMFATAISGAVVSMPYAGNLNITYSGADGPVIINNPFIRNAATRFVLSGNNGTLAFTSPGRITLTTTGGAGTYVVSVGNRNDRRVNAPFTQ